MLQLHEPMAAGLLDDQTQAEAPEDAKELHSSASAGCEQRTERRSIVSTSPMRAFTRRRALAMARPIVKSTTRSTISVGMRLSRMDESARVDSTRNAAMAPALSNSAEHPATRETGSTAAPAMTRAHEVISEALRGDGGTSRASALHLRASSRPSSAAASRDAVRARGLAPSNATRRGQRVTMIDAATNSDSRAIAAAPTRSSHSASRGELYRLTRPQITGVQAFGREG